MQRRHHSPAEVRLREFLREKRQQRGLTQLALSRALDGSRAFVAKYESGERFLTFTEVVLICKLLGIDPADIAHEIGAHTEDVAVLVPQPSKVGRPRKFPSGSCTDKPRDSTSFVKPRLLDKDGF